MDQKESYVSAEGTMRVGVEWAWWASGQRGGRKGGDGWLRGVDAGNKAGVTRRGRGLGRAGLWMARGRL